MKLEVKKLDPRAKLPVYFFPGDAGLNLFAVEDVVIPAHERVMITTGLSLAVPGGYVGLVHDRSSMAAKAGVHALAGVIDAGFRGEFKLVFLNTSNDDYKISAGDKVAQFLIQPVERVEVVEVEELPPTERGAGGFGSTGK
ncbi:MAG: dUTP diphosphatase [Candidatus Veblenbacteria bacterium]|nr:dUTP diphosphatase [Candidatus Veblenbacteria bacterium]